MQSSDPAAATNANYYLKCVLFNARSIVNKLTELHMMLSNDCPDIVCITESWLNNLITDAVLVGGNKYCVYRCDRSSIRGGGVAILANNTTVSSIPVNIPAQFSDVEAVAIDLIGSSFSYRFINCYRKPSSDTDAGSISYTRKLIAMLEYLSCTDASLIVLGDFNLPNINWSTDMPCQPTVCIDDDDIGDGCCNMFSSYLQVEGLYQFVGGPTRIGTGSSDGNLLDLVISNDIFSVNNLTIDDPFSTSDHCCINFSLLYTDTPYNKSYSHSVFSQANWNDVNDYLYSADWSAVNDDSHPIDSRFNNFYNILNDCVAQLVPTKTVNKSSHPVARINKNRYPAHIAKLLTRKRSAWRLHRQFKTPQLLAKFKLASAKCRSAIYWYTLNKEEKLIETGNLGKFYRHCNKSLRSRSNVGSIRLGDGSLTNNPAQKASSINDYFSTVYTADNGIILPSPDTPAPPHHEISQVQFSQSDVYKCLRNLNARSSGGPDNIPPMFLKNCASALAAPLASLFQTSFRTGFLPDIWKMAFVTPIFKKGDASQPSNYRPISLTCTCCKVMESIIKTSMLAYLSEHNIISRQQHGFLAKHSTSTNLLECIQDWVVKLDSKAPVDVVYVDFSRAFDSVVHSKLLSKLHVMGISGSLLDWIGSFLTSRKQCTVVDHCTSKISDVNSGVIQGSCLGPILFLLFINDLVDVIHSGVTSKMYADDLKLYCAISLQTSSSNVISQAINDLVAWADRWQLAINIAKCHVLHLGRGNPRNAYCINNCRIDDVANYVTDLGVDVDIGLKFDTHISNIIRKAHQRIAVIFRGFVSRNPQLLVKAYITFVRPILEYCSSVWSPVLIKHVNALERVQKYFTRKLRGMERFSYLERLSLLGLDSLELRRLRLDIYMYYKIIHNMIALSVDTFFHFDDRQLLSIRSYDPNNLVKPMITSAYIKQDFCVRCIDVWNFIPIDIRNIATFLIFKRALATLDFTRFLIGTFAS